MAIELNNLRLDVNYTDEQLKEKCAKKLKIKIDNITTIHKIKESIDARKKDDVHKILNVAVDVKTMNKNLNLLKNIKVDYSGLKYAKKAFKNRPIVVGFGPSGMFCALALSEMGLNPIVIEQGKDVDSRKTDIDQFWNNAHLNEFSNVQFGEGGAGTFSDGKLTTNNNSKLNRKILNEFVLAGAPNEIYYKSKPHIGSDNLPIVVKNIRQKIIKNGGQIFFQHKFNDLEFMNENLLKVKCLSLEENKVLEFETSHLILAIGHSDYATFKLLKDKKITMQPKPFAIGVRIEQNQKKINFAQYGNFAKYLPSADYKLVEHLENGRNVFTFCMCPGGQVVASSCEEGTVVTNGMSNFARNLENANSALLVNVLVADFYNGDVLDGFKFQKKYEKLAFEIGGKNYSAPVQSVGDFLNNKLEFKENFIKNNEKNIKNAILSSKNDKSDKKNEKEQIYINPTYRPKTTYCEIKNCLPPFVTESLKIALPRLNSKIDGFADESNLLTAIETKTSCPVQILRNEFGESNIPCVYPIGEGAGYAGGIMTSAVDGVLCAEKIYDKI